MVPFDIIVTAAVTATANKAENASVAFGGGANCGATTITVGALSAGCTFKAPGACTQVRARARPARP